MKKSKKFLGSIALLSTLLALGACGDKDDKKDDSSSIQQSSSEEQKSSSEEQKSSSEEPSSSEEVNLPYETVKTELLADNFRAGVFQNDKKYGILTISKNSEVVNRIREYNDTSINKKFSWNQAFKVDKAGKNITIKTPKTYVDPDTGEANNGKLVLYVQNGSSGLTQNDIKIQNLGDKTQFTNLKYDATASVAKIEYTIPNDYLTEDEDALRTFVISMGDTGKTSYIYQMSFESVYDKGEPESFEIYDEGTVDFMVGQDYSNSSMILHENYTNGKINVIDLNSSDLTLDASKYQKNTTGTYDCSIKYKNYDAVPFKVNVLEPQDITLGFNSTYLGKSNSAGNSCYINGKAKTIYNLNEEFDESYINASILAKLDTTEKEFLVTTDELEFSGFDSSTTGVKTVTAKYKSYDISTTFDVTVIDTSVPYIQFNPSLMAYTAYVDDDYTGENGVVDTVDGKECMKFKTIGAALEVLEQLGKNNNGTYDTENEAYNARKVLYIAPGYYNEKLEINVPNLTIIGSGSCKSTHKEDTENWDENAFKNATVIEWDSLYGIPDEGGFSQVTDSVQTVAIRDTAINCEMINLTLSNYWNCEGIFVKEDDLLAKYNLSIGGKVSEHRALALLCQSDHFIMESCSMLGYQDTVEFFYGRQRIIDTYVTGCTDFIFGTNCTTYFENCEIHVIEKNNDTSYITAMKGYNKSKADAVVYGIIFDGCNFTADSAVKANSASIGRTWGECSAVMTMNCTLGAHVATNTNRYITMNAKPTDATVHFVEYNNQGQGAKSSGTHSVDGFEVLTDSTEASKYANFEIIFGTSNGGTTYEEAWAGYGYIVGANIKV